MHPPTMYFPLIVDEALMFEPTETGRARRWTGPPVSSASWWSRRKPTRTICTPPRTTVVGRPDDVTAARSLFLKYEFCE